MASVSVRGPALPVSAAAMPSTQGAMHATAAHAERSFMVDSQRQHRAGGHGNRTDGVGDQGVGAGGARSGGRRKLRHRYGAVGATQAAVRRTCLLYTSDAADERSSVD